MQGMLLRPAQSQRLATDPVCRGAQSLAGRTASCLHQVKRGEKTTVGLMSTVDFGR